MPFIPKVIIKQVAKKYIAGDTLDDAVQATKELESIGGMATIDVLGEFVDNKERALNEKAMSLKVIEAIGKNNLNAYLSLKPTSLGLGIDEDFAYNNVKELIIKSEEFGRQVCIDMENSPYTSKTINLFKRIKDSGSTNAGMVIQAYMRRSEQDINDISAYKPTTIRLCKGIYREAPEIAFQGKEEVRDNYKRLLEQIIDLGLYVGIATHDEDLIMYALDMIRRKKLPHDKYEFQMLLGVRDERRNQLLKDGHPLRVYVPFGEDWYGYSTRRLKENPKMAGQIFKAMFSNK